MHIEETFQGPLTRTTDIYRFEVNRNDSGGSVSFNTLQRLFKDGQMLGVGEMKSYSAAFHELPETFPVTVNGNVVQVSGQTILDALDSVALAVYQLREE